MVMLGDPPALDHCGSDLRVEKGDLHVEEGSVPLKLSRRGLPLVPQPNDHKRDKPRGRARAGTYARRAGRIQTAREEVSTFSKRFQSCCRFSTIARKNLPWRWGRRRSCEWDETAVCFLY
jgi:hypothetical protein